MHDHFNRGSASIRSFREPGLALVTTCCANRESLLVDPSCASAVLDCLLWLDRHRRITLNAAVAMPDHLHFVAEPVDRDWAAVMHSLKRYTAQRINRILDRSGNVWQSQYHDRRIASDSQLGLAIEYCRMNPVRAGLVQEAKDYPHYWCSSAG
jgi:putative transposase